MPKEQRPKGRHIGQIGDRVTLSTRAFSVELLPGRRRLRYTLVTGDGALVSFDTHETDTNLMPHVDEYTVITVVVSGRVSRHSVDAYGRAVTRLSYITELTAGIGLRAFMHKSH